jgi:hypothetical protein
MGTIRRRYRARRAGPADALFSPVQQRVLGLLFGQPARRFQSAELIRLGSGTGAVHRQLKRLTEAGWINAYRIGNQKYYQANWESPAFGELHQLVLKTFCLVEPLRQALSPEADGIKAAFVYGSVARVDGVSRKCVSILHDPQTSVSWVSRWLLVSRRHDTISSDGFVTTSGGHSPVSAECRLAGAATHLPASGSRQLAAGVWQQ